MLLILSFYFVLFANYQCYILGNFEGKLFLNGHAVTEEVMIKISGFVPQYDISFEQLTVIEHLFLMVVYSNIIFKLVIYLNFYVLLTKTEIKFFQKIIFFSSF